MNPDSPVMRRIQKKKQPDSATADTRLVCETFGTLLVVTGAVDVTPWEKTDAPVQIFRFQFDLLKVPFPEAMARAQQAVALLGGALGR